MCIHKRNNRGKCRAQITTVPKRNSLKISKYEEKKNRYRYFLNYASLLTQGFLSIGPVHCSGNIHVCLYLGQFDPLEDIECCLSECPVDN